MTISQYLTQATNKLKVKNPRLEAEILLSYVLKKPREYLLAHPGKKLTKTQISNYQSLITKRAKGIPTAYLTGYKYFHGLKFLVNKNVLIPRPETEMVVDEALRISRIAYRVSHNSKGVTFVDVGTGSGCIIITLAKKHSKFNIKYIATDVSSTALAVARKNAKLHKVDKKIKFLQGNLLEPILKNKKIGIRNYNLVILANLPYLTPTQIKKSPSIKYEPKLALDARKDGLKYYKKLFQQITQITNYPCLANPAETGGAGKLLITVLCEIDPSQKSKIKQIIKKELPKTKVQIKKDLRGLDRLAIIKFNN